MAARMVGISTASPARVLELTVVAAIFLEGLLEMVFPQRKLAPLR